MVFDERSCNRRGGVGGFPGLLKDRGDRSSGDELGLASVDQPCRSFICIFVKRTFSSLNDGYL
jgi:hypothetical protein